MDESDRSRSPTPAPAPDLPSLLRVIASGVAAVLEEFEFRPLAIWATPKIVPDRSGEKKV
jgi:hypothetical protein